MTTEIDADFHRSFDNAQAALAKGARATFEKVLRDFDLRFIVEEIHDPRRDQLRKRMKEFVDEAGAQLNESITMDLARAQAESR